MNTKSNNSGSAYNSPNVELTIESERVYKAFCCAIQLNTGLKETALKQKIEECNNATRKLLFGTNAINKQELNTMEQVYLNWHLWLMTTTIAAYKGVSVKELLAGIEQPLFPLTDTY